jgi:hypothetical protein
LLDFKLVSVKFLLQLNYHTLKGVRLEKLILDKYCLIGIFKNSALLTTAAIELVSVSYPIIKSGSYFKITSKNLWNNEISSLTKMISTKSSKYSGPKIKFDLLNLFEISLKSKNFTLLGNVVITNLYFL